MNDPRRGGILSSLLFTCLALMLLAAFAGMYVLRNVRVDTTHAVGGGDDVSIRTPGGSFRIRAHEKLDPASLGVPLYPGAIRTKDSGGASFEWSSEDGGDDKAFAVAGASMITQDSPDKVLSFYKSQLPNWIVVNERGGATRLELREGGFRRIVAIHEKRDGTHIGVATVGAPGSN